MTTLKKLRDAAGVTRDEFAQRTGVKRSTLEKHEQGRHRIPLENARIYAEHLASLTSQSPSKLLGQLAGLESV